MHALAWGNYMWTLATCGEDNKHWIEKFKGCHCILLAGLSHGAGGPLCEEGLDKRELSPVLEAGITRLLTNNHTA